ncbi:MAG TPA: hypothetical protein VII80_02600 [Pseudolabrys sp.]|jgi:hypothetical protein
MRRMQRIVLLAALVALAPVLVGCENFDMDKLDVFGLNEKKKLPGDRKAVFPEGVPGVSQGIPPEFIKGNQPPPDTAQAVPAEQDDKATAAAPAKKTAAVEPAQEPKPKPKRKPKPRAQPAAQSQSGGQAQQSAWPTQGQQQAPQQAQSPGPGSGQSTSSAPWPSAPAPGTFSR